MLADIELSHEVETDMLESVDSAVLGRELAHELCSATHHLVKVLDNKVIDLLGAQKRFGNSI